mmetsp:Transcript_4131/g.9858  ORF Transcript_4131/g.9858 Transcript_4131/m.9858 type:complete len:319 (-) Transcript_4131:953-1909(-)
MVKKNKIKKIISRIFFPKRIIIGHEGKINALSINYRKKIFGSGSSDSTFKIWDLNTFSYISEYKGHIGSIETLLLSEKHDLAFSGGEDMIIKCWDTEYNKIIANYSGHFSGITALSMHPILNILVSSSKDCTTRIWDLRMRKEIKSLVGHKDTVTSVLTNTESPHIITSSLDRTLCLWDIVMNKPFCKILSHKNGILDLVKDFSDTYFLSLSKDIIKIWRKDGTFVKKYFNHNSSNINLCIGKDSKIIVSEKGNILNHRTLKKKKNCQYFTKPPEIFNFSKKNSEISSLVIDDVSGGVLCGKENREICIFSEKWVSLS